MKKSLLAVIVVISILISPLKSIAGQTDNFIDIKGNWAEQDIKTISALGFMSGVNTNQGELSFAPDKSVSRAQLASTLVRLFQLDYGQIRFIKEPLASDYYQDVSDTAWYADAAVLCSINKIFPSESKFNPDRSITRIELAQAVKNCFSAQGINVPMIMLMPEYADTKDLTQDEKNAMVFVSNTSIMKGDGDNFYPNKLVNRAELAKVINNCLKLVELNESSNGQEVTIKTGQSFIVSLESNPTTGYDWSVKSWDENTLQERKVTYVEQNGQNAVGQGGRNYWEFKGIQPGTVNLHFVYARPWESVQPLKEFSLKIIINPDGNSNNSSVQIDSRDIMDFSEKLNINAKVPVISGVKNKTVQSAINNLLTKKVEDYQNELTAEWEEYAKSAEGHAPIRPFELASVYKSGLVSDKLLSFYVDYYQYTGGAHGITARISYNFDLQTGKELTLQDLFAEDYDYKQVINAEVNKQIAAHPEIYYQNAGAVEIVADQNYYLCDDRLVIYFGQYEIAPYASGIREFEIPFSTLQGGLKADLK